jgi:hypothetical protein
MSDLNDLIHTNAHNAYAIGVKTERERIIQLLPEIFETYFAKDQIIDEVTKRIMRQEQK